MDCPKCVGKLKATKIENETIDVCWVCEGIWFDDGELEKIIEADSKNFKKIDAAREEFDGKELAKANIDLNSKKGQCPRCGELMTQSEYQKDVVIDSCPNGHGIWLDGGELQKLRKRNLVEFADKFKFIFSGEGFASFLSKFKGKKK